MLNFAIAALFDISSTLPIRLILMFILSSFAELIIGYIVLDFPRFFADVI
jgi:hypothetical protein